MHTNLCLGLEDPSLLTKVEGAWREELDHGGLDFNSAKKRN